MASTARYALVLLLLAAPVLAEEVPPSPFAPPGRAAKPRGRWGSVLLLGGEKKEETLTGHISFTYGKLLRIHDTGRKDLTMLRPSEIVAIDVEIEKESIEEEWTWKEMGSDEKIKTGRTYPDRTYRFTLTLKDKKKPGTPGSRKLDSVPVTPIVQGHIIGTPVYVTDAKGKTRRVVLRTHQRGDFGARLEELIYVARVAFHDKDTPPPWPLKKEGKGEGGDGKESGESKNARPRPERAADA